jgi:hypothetical protein
MTWRGGRRVVDGAGGVGDGIEILISRHDPSERRLGASDGVFDGRRRSRSKASGGSDHQVEWSWVFT